MTERRSARRAALWAGLLSSCIAAVAVGVAACAPGSSGSVNGSANPQAAGRPLGHSHDRGDEPGSAEIRMDAIRDAFTACEQRIERAAGHIPTLAIVGASYTAGVGPSNPSLSWAAELARNLRWDAVIYGDPGAGYTRAGSNGLGPMTRLLGAERLPSLSPSLVLVQAGYDDGRVPPDLERQQVRQTMQLIRSQAPHAKIGLVTVFTIPARPIPARFYRVDATIIAAARSVDSNVIVMDPLLGQWVFQHADDNRGLHPTAAGDAWIARKVGAILRADGIEGRPAAGGAAPITCDLRVLASTAEPETRA